jgi:hypothetical protein
VKGEGKDEGEEVGRSNGAAHVHVTVSMSLAVLVEFVVEVGQVRGMGDSKCVKDESMPLRATLIVI